MEPLDMQELIKKSIDRALKERGVANVIIAGKTGVGKSTLINTVFQGRMAETGQGRPVTQQTRRITKEGVPVAIYDTRGLEVKDYAPILKELLGVVKTANGSKDPLEHIHVAWLCIGEGGRRVEEAEIELGRALSDYMPVIVVITKAMADQGFRQQVQQLFPFARNVVRVNSVEDVLDDGTILRARGVDDLVDLTMEVIPEGQKKAFAAAQRIKLSHQRDQAHKVVFAAASTASMAAAAPIPFADAVAIVPVQVSMLAGVSAAYGLNVNKAFLGTLVSGLFVGVAGTLGGRALVGSLLKFFPGAGSVAGAAISATVAGSLTLSFGEAYVATLYKLLQDNPEGEVTAAEIARVFKERLSSLKKSA